MIKILKNDNTTIDDCKKIGDEIAKINQGLDEIMKIIPYKFNVNTLDQFLEIKDKIDILGFQMQEEALKAGILDDLDWPTQSNIIRR